MLERVDADGSVHPVPFSSFPPDIARLPSLAELKGESALANPKSSRSSMSPRAPARPDPGPPGPGSLTDVARAQLRHRLRRRPTVLVVRTKRSRSQPLRARKGAGRERGESLRQACPRSLAPGSRFTLRGSRPRVTRDARGFADPLQPRAKKGVARSWRNGPRRAATRNKASGCRSFYRECDRERNRRWYAAHREEKLASLKAKRRAAGVPIRGLEGPRVRRPDNGTET